MDYLYTLSEWATRYQDLIFLVCPPIIFMYVGYRIGTRGKFHQLRRKVLYVRKRAENKNRHEYDFPKAVQVLGTEIIRARNFDQITEIEKNYLTDTLNQILQMPIYFRR